MGPPLIGVGQGVGPLQKKDFPRRIQRRGPLHHPRSRKIPDLQPKLPFYPFSRNLNFLVFYKTTVTTGTLIDLCNPRHHLMSPNNLPNLIYQPRSDIVNISGMLLPCLHDTRPHRHSSGIEPYKLYGIIGTLLGITVIYPPQHSALFHLLLPVLHARPSRHLMPTLQSIPLLLVPLWIRLLIQAPLTM